MATGVPPMKRGRWAALEGLCLEGRLQAHDQCLHGVCLSQVTGPVSPSERGGTEIPCVLCIDPGAAHWLWLGRVLSFVSIWDPVCLCV